MKGKMREKTEETRTARLPRTRKSAFAALGHKVAPFELSSVVKIRKGGSWEEGEKSKPSPNQEQFENPPQNI